MSSRRSNQPVLHAESQTEENGERVRKRICVYDCRDGRGAERKSLEATSLDFNDFLRVLQKAFQIPSRETFVLVTTDRTVLSFNTFEELEDGSTLYVLKQEDQVLPTATKERIDFTPHYNTLIESGKHEYSTCEGKKPFSYALAELIDNALSATVTNKGARSIEIRMLLDETLGKPAVVVLDNGCGMSPEDLNDWAKYRLCKFKRKKKTPSKAYIRPDAVPRSLNSDISYFGVGGKHSAFYIGESAMMISRKRGSPDVHELTLSKEDFQNKEKNKEDMFSTVITNRRPGDFSHVTKDDERFLQELIREETRRESFTAVVITEVQPEHIDFMKEKYEVLTRQLAHVYHYYIHGVNGNSMSSSNLDHSAKVDVQVTLREKPPRLPRVMNLREVEDDMQSLYINSAADTFEFRASAPNGGIVEGIIRYHPFLYDRETYPEDPDAKEESEEDEASNDEEESGVVSQTRSKRSIFDFYWNGRLIPKTGPFEFEWCKPPKVNKLPAECYDRFSGVLFTNDAFKVTTNKLSFVDLDVTLRNTEIIFTRVEKGKNRRIVKIQMEFADWLQTCHDKHDKQIKFVGYKETITREDLTKNQQHPWETFSSIEWDGKIYKKGQLAKTHKTNPIHHGTISQFLRFGETEKTNGSVFATGGFVELVLEPKALHDKNKIIAISKIDKTATEEAIRKRIEEDSAKLPETLRVEWPEGNPWKQNACYPAGTQLGPLRIKILDKNGASISKMPKSERGPGKALDIQLRIVRHGCDEDVTSLGASYSPKWAFWFKKNESLTELGKYTLFLNCVIHDGYVTVIGDKKLPSYELSFSITEGSAHKFAIAPLMNPVRVGVPFNIPLQMKDAYDHLAPPPPHLEPLLKCSGLELSFEKADIRGNMLTIKGVRAKGKVLDYGQMKTYDLKVTLPGLKEDTQMIKISLLPGNPHSLHVRPADDPIIVENGHSVKFDVEVHDEAGNITANPKQIVQCKVAELAPKAIDCSSTGAGQLETEPIKLLMMKGVAQMHFAEFDMPSKKNMVSVVRELKVVPSRRVSRMELGSVVDENLVLKNNDKIEWLVGSSLENLFFKLFDEAGRDVPLSPEIAEKIKVNWTGDVDPDDLLQGRLPDLQVPTRAHGEHFYQVSYQDQSVSFSFSIIPRPDEPSQLKATLSSKNPVKLGDSMPGITLELLDQYDNDTQTLTPACVDHMKVEAEGLDQSSVDFVFKDKSSSVVVEGLKFQSGTPGSRELCVTYKSFEDRVIVKVTNGDPAQLKLVSGPEMPLQLFNDKGIPTPFVIQLYDKWENPCPDQRVSVELSSSPATLKVMSSVTSQPVNAEGKASFTVKRVSGPKGYYQLEFKGSFNRKPIPGPSVNLTVIPDPLKPVRLSVRYDSSATFTAGGKFTAFAVTVESEDGSPMTTFNPAAASMLLWSGASSGAVPPHTATELKCSKPMENENNDCFHFRDKDVPEHVGEYTVQFSLRLDREKVLHSSQIKIQVEASQPVKLGAKSQPPPPVVSYSKDISNRTLVQNLTLFIMDSFGNPAGQKLNGKVLVSIRESENAGGGRNIPLFEGNSSSCEISLVDGKAHIDRLNITQNSPGDNGSSYTLVFEPSVPSAPLAPFTLLFHFFNDMENQKKMSQLSKKKVEICEKIQAYKSIFATYDELLPLLKGKCEDASAKEAEQRKKLISSRVISTQIMTLQDIRRLIEQKNKDVDRIFNTPRRVFPHRDQFKDQQDVLGMVGHLAFLKDDREARVISWHLRGDMKCVVTRTREAALKIHQENRGQQVVLPLTNVLVSQGYSPLPHTKGGRLLFQPRGNPVYARELLIYPTDQDRNSCEIVFKNFLGNTILIDDLDSGNHYREMAVKNKIFCPAILTRQGNRINAKGTFGGTQNSAPPNMTDVFGAPLPLEYYTLKEQIELLCQYGIVVENRDNAAHEYQELLNKQTSPEMLGNKAELDKTMEELDDVNKQIESSRVGPVKRPGEAGASSGTRSKRAKPTS